MSFTIGLGDGIVVLGGLIRVLVGGSGGSWRSGSEIQKTWIALHTCGGSASDEKVAERVVGSELRGEWGWRKVVDAAA